MKTTENLGLRKPAENDFYDVNDFNNNADALDALFEKDENGSVAAKNAKTLDGLSPTFSGEKGIPQILSDYGIMEIGGMVDFHTAEGQDYKMRLVADESTKRLVFYNDNGEAGYIVINTDLLNYLPKIGGIFPKANENDGGRVQFEKPDNSPISGNLFMDFHKIGLRFFEGFGDTRGAFLDLTKCGVGCSSELLHTGNKPTGTYTGNGSAELRTIHVGGLGDDMLFSAGDEIGFVGYHGAVIFNVRMKEVFHFTAEEMNFRGGILTIATDSVYVNSNGGLFTYHVI